MNGAFDHDEILVPAQRHVMHAFVVTDEIVAPMAANSNGTDIDWTAQTVELLVEQ